MNTTPTQQPAPDHGEPWKLTTDFAFDITINDTLAASFDKIEHANRAVSCVNACAGMVDPAKEIQAMREAIKNATSALEDWQLLWREIRGQQCSRAHQDGVAVNTATAAALAKLQPFLKL